MKKKIILDRFKQSSLKYFYINFKKLDFEVKIITYNEKITSPLENFSAELLNDFEIARGSFFKDLPWMLEPNDLEFLSQYEGLFCNLLSRYAISPEYWASHEMSVHAIQLFNYWKYKLIDEKIEICFAFYAPHEPSSFSLYLVSKLLKIPYIFIDDPIIAQKYRYMSCSFKHRNLLIHNKNHHTPNLVKKDIEQYQYKITNDFKSSLPPFMIEKNTSLNRKSLFYKILFSLKNKNLLEKLLKLLLPSANIFFKYNRLEWYSNKAIPGRISFFFKKYNILRKISKKGEDYKKICTSFKNELINTNYIYFAAPLSPESSTIPAALSNRHIKIAILKLLDVLPENWKVVYKANPVQFSQNTRYNFSTFPDWFTSDFYYDLLKTGKVSFVDINTSTLELIKNSKGVASICGTVSVEAIALAKRAITFSSMWYDDLSGIHLCKTQKDLKETINAMLSNEHFVPSFLNVHLSSASIFDIGDFIIGDYSENIYCEILNKFISSYEVFNSLDEKKWNI